MKRLLWAFALALPTAAWAAGTLTVMVREAAVKKSPQFYASTIATAKLGEKLQARQAQAGWHQVTVAGKTGWVHQSAVTEKKVQLGSADTVGASRTSAEEITLAGKGFNNQVEGSYKKKRPGSNFEAVDQLEATQLSESEVLSFVAEGGLGGAK